MRGPSTSKPAITETIPSDLFQEMTSFWNLRQAALRCARGKRMKPAACAFLCRLEPEVLALQRELRAGTWQPAAPVHFWVREPKPRRIAAAAFRDRVVHQALCAAVEPILEADADPDSYACRRHKGTHRAMARVQALASVHPWYGKLDVQKYFETLPHVPLLALLNAYLPDNQVQGLFATILGAGAAAPGIGVPIGALTSQHLANFYLGQADRLARQILGVGGQVRYMDDMILFGPDKTTVWAWLRALECFLDKHLGLKLRPAATMVAPVHVGIPFLGCRVWPAHVRLDASGKRRFLRKARRQLAQAHLDGETGAAATRSLHSLFGWAAQATGMGLRLRLVQHHDPEIGHPPSGGLAAHHL